MIHGYSQPVILKFLHFYFVVLTQRLHREPTTRTKRAQKMQDAHHRSMGMANHTPGKTGYARVTQDNGSPHWTIRRK